MQIITTKTQVYKYNELPKEVQSKVLENLYDLNTDYEWYELTIDESKKHLSEMGFDEATISFSGFSSQGDGASFDASVDLKKWLKIHRLSNKYRALYNHADEVSVSITKSGHYEHEYTMGIDSDYYSLESEKAQNQLLELENKILEDAREEARIIYKTLEKEYEYLTNEDAIIETIEANDYNFTINGKIF